MNLPVVLVAALVGTAPWFADVGDYLERSAEAEFTGEQIVSCDTPDGDRSSIFNLAQTDGTVVAWDRGEESSMVGVAPGRTVTVTGDAVETAVVEGSALVEADRYTAEEGPTSTYLGREVTEVSLVRDGTERVRLTIDSESSAVLRTVTFTADGDSYCDRRLLSFEEDLGGVPQLALDAAPEPSTPIDEAPDELAETVDGFVLVDTYELEEGTLSYYSDGFFSAGVALTDRPVSVGEGEEVVEFELENGTYERVYAAGSVTVTWEADPGNVVLMGDLPPDLVDSFLQELPAPRQSGFFDRIWSRLFG